MHLKSIANRPVFHEYPWMLVKILFPRHPPKTQWIRISKRMAKSYMCLTDNQTMIPNHVESLSDKPYRQTQHKTGWIIVLREVYIKCIRKVKIGESFLNKILTLWLWEHVCKKEQLLHTIKNKMNEVKWLKINLNQDMSIESG